MRASVPVANHFELRIFGLQRSGIHAIVNWIVQQSAGPTLFINDIRSLIENPYAYAEDFNWYCGPGKSLGGDGIAAERSGTHAEKEYLILGYEDTDLRHLPVGFDDLLRDALGASKTVKDILIVRDPFNLFASRFGFSNSANRHPMHSCGSFVRGLWKCHAREALGRTRYLQAGPLVVQYNRWFVDPAYRRALAEDLGLRFTDRGLEAVPGVDLPASEFARFGCGSSFDRHKYHGQAQKMDVLNRWKRFAGDEGYLRLLNDPELLELSHELFGHLRGTEMLTLS